MPSPSTSRNPHVVAIGADAGSAAALITLLEQVGPLQNLALVVVGSGQEAEINDLHDTLARRFDGKVGWVEAGASPQAERMLVVRGDARATFTDGVFAVEPADRDAAAFLSLDTFLLSLAAAFADCAVAIGLSATALECARGMRAIKEAGGTVMTLALPSGQPRTLSAGLVLGMADFSLPPEELARALVEHVERECPHGPLATMRTTVRDIDLENIVQVIDQQLGVDFSDYKKSTLIRRIERRMNVHQIDDAADYLATLREDHDEITTLFREFLIGVTRFFRDPATVQALVEDVIPSLVARDKARDTIRIWVAGCSTGEEAYSIAMLLHEAIIQSGRDLSVKIFATDLDREAVEFASQGLYPQSAMADVSRERLARHFVRKGDFYQVSKGLREMLIFAPHNLIKDPPFYKLDLISCRNLLIYLQPTLQRKLLTVFHFALNPEAFLVLGTSETLGEMAQFFSVVDAREKIFRKKGGNRLSLPVENFGPDLSALRTTVPRTALVKGEGGGFDESVQGLINNALLREFAPTSLVVNERFEIAHIFGSVDKFLRLPPGKPTFNVLTMASRELSVALGTAIRKAMREGRTVVFDDVLGGDRDTVRIRLTIKPLRAGSAHPTYALVVFEHVGATEASPAESFDLETQSGQRIKDLELEIAHTSESLQAAIEELETSNEELQATNEEVLAANEELQSTNEELQSVNEELYTVNAEYHAKITELTELNDDILNFLSSTNIGTLFLDQRLCFRKFTPAITRQINLIDKDIGRPLEHLSHNIVDVDLAAIARDVLKTLVPVQREVRAKDGKWYLMRLLPYRTEDNVIKGVVLTFIDISEVKLATENVRKLSMVIEQSTNLVMITAADGAIEYVNRRFCDVSGYTSEEVVGKNPRIFKSGTMRPEDYRQMWRTVAGGDKWEGRFHNRTKSGDLFWENAVIIPIRDGAGKITNYLKTALIDGR
jgi:two-component system, chemotaxis family, CheB/CheR fusion protein